MTPEQTIPVRDAAEPRAGTGAIPLWLVLLCFGAVFFALVYFDEHGGWFRTEIYTPFHTPDQLLAFQPPKVGFDRVLAQKKYEAVCGICHQPDGMGRPGQFPPLAGSEWANGPVTRLARIPILGLSGPVKVKGQPWNLSMPALGSSISDDDLAMILTYVRSSWGNKAPEVKSAEVKAIRAEVGGRTQPLAGEAELSKVPEK